MIFATDPLFDNGFDFGVIVVVLIKVGFSFTLLLVHVLSMNVGGMPRILLCPFIWKAFSLSI